MRWPAAWKPISASWQICEAMEEALIQQRDSRGVWTLTMNRPDNFNALGDEMLDAL